MCQAAIAKKGFSVIKEIGRFDAKADNGIRYTVRHIQHYATFISLDGVSERKATTEEYKTTSGLSVYRLQNGSFEIVKMGKVIRMV